MSALDKLDEREQGLIASIDRGRLIEHTRTIAKSERLSGSVEELEAFQNIQLVQNGFGYHTRLMRADALISLPNEARLHISGLGEVECITHSMGVSSSELSGKLIYCDFGTTEDYRRVVASNKIALTDGIATPGKVKAGEDSEAIAQIPISGDHLHEMCISTVWGSPTPDNAAFLPRTSAHRPRPTPTRALISTSACVALVRPAPGHPARHSCD
jgi:hypothetical protein